MPSASDKDDKYILTALLLFGPHFNTADLLSIDGPGNLAGLSFQGFIDYDGGWYVTQKGLDFIKEK